MRRVPLVPAPAMVQCPAMDTHTMNDVQQKWLPVELEQFWLTVPNQSDITCRTVLTTVFQKTSLAFVGQYHAKRIPSICTKRTVLDSVWQEPDFCWIVSYKSYPYIFLEFKKYNLSMICIKWNWTSNIWEKNKKFYAHQFCWTFPAKWPPSAR